jgi:hypothetical protein
MKIEIAYRRLSLLLVDTGILLMLIAAFSWEIVSDCSRLTCPKLGPLTALIWGAEDSTGRRRERRCS